MLASFLKVSEKIASENAENCRSRQPHYRLRPPPQGTSANIRINHIPPESRVIGLCIASYIYAADSVDLSAFKFLWWVPKDILFCNRVRIGRSRSSKVVDFDTIRKGVCDFLLVITGNSRVFGLSAGEDFMILACVVLTQCQRVTGRQTYGRTDRHPYRS